MTPPPVTPMSDERKAQVTCKCGYAMLPCESGRATQFICTKCGNSVLLAQADQPEVCICAAIRLDDGEIFRGHRHDDALRTAGKTPGIERERVIKSEQGFMTSRNRFVDREEGARLQHAAGIVSAHTGKLPTGLLFSEDLYLRPGHHPSEAQR